MKRKTAKEKTKSNELNSSSIKFILSNFREAKILRSIKIISFLMFADYLMAFEPVFGFPHLYFNGFIFLLFIQLVQWYIGG